MAAAAASAEPYPEYESVYVNDFADALDAETEGQLTDQLKAIREDHGVEMTVVTIETVGDFDPADSWEAFATRLFNGWGIGDPDRNDGVLFLFAMTDRDMRLELGAGYDREWDQAAAEIVQNIMVPNFKQGKINGGVKAGVGTMIARIRTNIAEGRAATDTPYGLKEVTITADGATITSTRRQAPEGGFDWLWYTLVVPVLGGGAFLTRRYVRMRPRYCQRCDMRMKLVDEMSDDAFLDEGSQLEESIKSVDYDVWQCAACGHAQIERWRKWFSRYGACKACNYRALESDRTVLRHASYSSDGLARIDYNCVHCGHSYSETKRIPRKTKSSSSSSSSFSGGRSSGGGASGSW
ncbi:MAG: TPM domain-containing protein [Pseudomonadota bacterium]